jgi:hypothetical protein
MYPGMMQDLRDKPKKVAKPDPETSDAPVRYRYKCQRCFGILGTSEPIDRCICGGELRTVEQ